MKQYQQRLLERAKFTNITVINNSPSKCLRPKTKSEAQ